MNSIIIFYENYLNFVAIAFGIAMVGGFIYGMFK